MTYSNCYLILICTTITYKIFILPIVCTIPVDLHHHFHLIKNKDTIVLWLQKPLLSPFYFVCSVGFHCIMNVMKVQPRSLFIGCCKLLQWCHWWQIQNLVTFQCFISCWTTSEYCKGNSVSHCRPSVPCSSFACLQQIGMIELIPVRCQINYWRKIYLFSYFVQFSSPRLRKPKRKKYKLSNVMRTFSRNQHPPQPPPLSLSLSLSLLLVWNSLILWPHLSGISNPFHRV